MKRFFSCLLAVCLLLSGWLNVAASARMVTGVQELWQSVQGTTMTEWFQQGAVAALEESGYDSDVYAFSRMVYERPDMEALRRSYETVQVAARLADERTIMKAVYDFYDEFDWFYTRYSLADIHYSMDLTDRYWADEYSFCVENSTEVDRLLEQVYYDLAASPRREALEGPRYFGRGFFDAYDGENTWDETYVSLLEQEASLTNRYYTLSEGALSYTGSNYYDACADDMAQLLVDLIRVRQQLAEHAGYEDYRSYAYDVDFYRDYTPEQMEAYLTGIREELVDLYRRMHDTDAWGYAGRYCNEDTTFRVVREAARAMGGTVWESFQHMEKGGLYDLTYGENKYAASFEVYLTSYGEPFLFQNSELTNYDQLTFAHEFGHFANDYVCDGCYAGIDVLEFFSQGMEYLTLCYGTDMEELTRVKLADSLATYVEQAAYASFENRMYQLTGEDLNIQALYDLYDQVALEYGFESVGYDPREFVDVTHFYTNPMYIVSYIVSNDAAMQLYEMEQRSTGTGLALFEENLFTQEDWFLAFVEQAGLQDPFTRLDQVRDTFAEEFA